MCHSLVNLIHKISNKIYTWKHLYRFDSRTKPVTMPYTFMIKINVKFKYNNQYMVLTLSIYQNLAILSQWKPHCRTSSYLSKISCETRINRGFENSYKTFCGGKKTAAKWLKNRHNSCAFFVVIVLGHLHVVTKYF